MRNIHLTTLAAHLRTSKGVLVFLSIMSLTIFALDAGAKKGDVELSVDVGASSTDSIMDDSVTVGLWPGSWPTPYVHEKRKIKAIIDGQYGSFELQTTDATKLGVIERGLYIDFGSQITLLPPAEDAAGQPITFQTTDDLINDYGIFNKATMHVGAFRSDINLLDMTWDPVPQVRNDANLRIYLDLYLPWLSGLDRNVTLFIRFDANLDDFRACVDSDYVTLTRVDANTWTVETNPPPDNQACIQQIINGAGDELGVFPLSTTLTLTNKDALAAPALKPDAKLATRWGAIKTGR